MNERFKLRQKLLAFAGAAGVDHADYVVPAGETITLIQATAMHDDVAARALDWRIIRGAVSFLTGSSASVAANTPLGIYAGNGNAPWPYILRYGDTLRVYCWSIGAGKIVSAQAAVETRVGDDTYGD